MFKVGDMVLVKMPGVKPYTGLAVKLNESGGALVVRPDGKLKYWVNNWCAKVINESR